MYEEELIFLKKVENPDDETNDFREVLSDEEIKILCQEYPSLPSDYLD